MKYIWSTIFLTLILFGSANAARLDITGDLTAEQKAEIILQAERIAAGNTDVPKTAEDVQKWAEVGVAVGEAMAGAAGKLGVEVNKFAETFVGKLTMFLIVWNYFGDDAVGLFFGLMWLSITLPTWFYLYRRKFVIDSITYNHKGEGPRKVVQYVNDRKFTEDQFGYMIIFALLAVVGVIPILTVG